MRYENVSETREQARRRNVAVKRAYSDGVHAFHAGLDGIADNPYAGWNKLPTAQFSERCLLWCRWLNGWLDEHFRATEQASGDT